MRTYALMEYDDGKEVAVKIPVEYLPVIVAALDHCARGSHRNVMRNIGHPLGSLILVVEQFEHIVAMEELYGREEVDPQDD